MAYPPLLKIVNALLALQMILNPFLSAFLPQPIQTSPPVESDLFEEVAQPPVEALPQVEPLTATVPLPTAPMPQTAEEIQAQYPAQLDPYAALPTPLAEDSSHPLAIDPRIPLASASGETQQVDFSHVTCSDGGTPGDTSDDTCTLAEYWNTDVRSEYDFDSDPPESCLNSEIGWIPEGMVAYPIWKNMWFGTILSAPELKRIRLHIPLTESTTISHLEALIEAYFSAWVSHGKYYLCDADGQELASGVGSYGSMIGQTFTFKMIDSEEDSPVGGVKDIYLAFWSNQRLVSFYSPANIAFHYLITTADTAINPFTTVAPDPTRAGAQEGDCPAENFGAGGCKGEGNPINTLTGNNTYTTTDLSIPTRFGSLDFGRSYSTFNAADVSRGLLAGSNLSPGWFHTYDVRLLFPADLGGEEDKILLQTAGGSRVGFLDNGGGNYSAEYGVGGTLTRTGGDPEPYVYTYTNSHGVQYVFDADGKLTAYNNGRGSQLDLTYDVNDLLELVNDAESQRGLHFSYVGSNLSTVEAVDTTDPQNLVPLGREINYGYDATGNLEWMQDERGYYWFYSYIHPSDLADPPDDILYTQHYLAKRHEATAVSTPDLQTLPFLVEYHYDADSLYTADNEETYVQAVEELNGAEEVIVALNFDPNGTTTVTNGVGAEDIHTYSARKLLSGETNDAGGTINSYDLNFRPRAVTDANENRTVIKWSGDGANLTYITDPLLHLTEFGYDETYPSHLTLVTGADGSQTVFVYNTEMLTNPTTGLEETNDDYHPAWDIDLLLRQYVLGATEETRYTYTNLVPNGNLESWDTTPDFWTFAGEAIQMVTGSANIQQGSYAAEITSGASSAATLEQNVTSPTDWLAQADIPAFADRTFTFGAWVKAPAADTARVYINDDVDTYYSNYATGGEYEWLAVEAPLSPSATQLVVGVEVAEGSHTVLVDGATLVESFVTGQNFLAPEPTNLVRRAVTSGVTTCYAYDASGQPLAVIQNCVDGDPTTGSSDEDVTTTYAYDGLGRLTNVTDPAGYTTHYTYNDGDDRADVVTRNYDPVKSDYEDGVWNLSTATFYDEMGRQIATVRNYLDDFGSDLTQTEIENGLPTNNNLVTRTYYNEAGRVSVTVENFVGDITAGTPPAFNPLAPEQNLATAYEYDAADNVLKTITNFDVGLSGGFEVWLNLVPDPDSIPETQIYINPANPDRNQITCTEYDTLNRPVFTRTACIPNAADYLLDEVSGNLYNLVTAYEYDAVGNVTKTIANYDPNLSDPAGYSVEVTLEPGQSPTSIIVSPDEPDRNVITCTEYDALNRPLFVRTACVPGQDDYLESGSNLYNLVSYYVYDEVGRQVATVRNYNDSDATFDQGQLVSLVLDSERNFITRTYYDALGRVEYVVNNFAGSWVDYADQPPAYDPLTPDRNLVTRTYYDDQGRQIATVRNYWDSNGDPLTADEIDDYPDRNLVTRTYYDSAGRVEHVVTNFVGDIISGGIPTFDPVHPDRNLVTSYEYDLLGRRVRTIRDRGTAGERITYVDYDDLGRSIEQIQNYENGIYDPLFPDIDVSSSTVYELLGRQVTVVDPEGNARQTIADALGRTTQTILDPAGLGITATTAYDVAGRAISQTNGEGEETETVYDALGRSIQTIVDPDGLDLLTTYTYDLMSRQILVTDPEDHDVRYDYDNLGRLIHVVENAQISSGCPSGNTDVDVCTAYQYDAAGSLIQVTLGNGSVTSYTYDALGRLLSEAIDPGGVNIVTNYAYDAAGNQVSVTRDPGGLAKETIYTYDALGRLLTITYPDSTPEVTYTYDAWGNRLVMDDGTVDREGRWAYRYDDVNRLLAVCSYLPDSVQTNGWQDEDCTGDLVTYTYDGMGNRTGLTVDGTPLDLTYTYDAANRLDTVSDPFAGGGAVVDYDYDDTSRVTTITRPNDLVTSYAYDPAGRLQELLNGTAAVQDAFSAFDYATLDGLGNRVDVNELLVEPAGGSAMMYGPDGLPHNPVADAGIAVDQPAAFSIAPPADLFTADSVVDEPAASPNTPPSDLPAATVEGGDHVPVNAAQAAKLGTITVCKLIVDQDGQFVDGSQWPEAAFSIDGLLPKESSGGPAAGKIGKTTFETPLTFSADLYGEDGILDAECVVYDKLELGGYYYAPEELPGADWAAARYNDQYEDPVFSLADFYEYDDNLFDGDLENDPERQPESDGHIVLTDALPQRTLVVLNQRALPAPTDTPTPTDTPSPTPTDTPLPTDTPTPTDTPVPTDTPTPTGTPGPTGTPTPAPSETPEPTGTVEPTGTPTPTDTPSPTPTVDPHGPPNDFIEKAYLADRLPYSFEQDVFGATVSADDPEMYCDPSGGFTYAGTVWYRLDGDPTARSESQLLAVDTTGSEYEVGIGVYEVDDKGTLSAVACGSNQVTFTAESASSYVFMLSRYGTEPFEAETRLVFGLSETTAPVQPRVLTASDVSEGIGVFNTEDGHWYQRNTPTTGAAEQDFLYGLPTDIPVAGDWNFADTVSTVGVFRNGVFYLNNQNDSSGPEITIVFGLVGDRPAIADWDGDGADEVGVFRPNDSYFFMRFPNGSCGGNCDPNLVFQYGIEEDIPLGGNWDGDSIGTLDPGDTVGVFRPSNQTFFLKNNNQSGYADIVITFGMQYDLPVVGDWNGDGFDDIAVYRPGNGYFYIDYNSTNPTNPFNGLPDASAKIDGLDGEAYSRSTPVAGYWLGFPPAAPSDLAATTNGTDQIDLTWSDNSSNETGFKIERKPDGGVWTQIDIVGADVTSYSDSGLTCETTYHYRVRAYNSDGNSDYTDPTASDTIGACAPSDLVATARGQGWVDLTWTDNASAEIGFKIERKPDGGDWTQIDMVGANVTSYSDSGLACETLYYYRVRAYNDDGDSDYSNIASDTTWICHTPYNWHHEYDPLSRLVYTCQEWDGQSCLGDEWNFSYDGAGNLVEMDRWDGAQVEIAAYVYNGANQIACLDGNADETCGDPEDVAYSYDAYGNLLSDGVNTYAYDAAMRLISVSDGVSTTTYTYNGDGDRVSQEVDGTLTTYVLDTAAPLTMVLTETTGPDTITYLHGLDLVAQSDGTSTEYFVNDGLGSVRQIVDAAGETLLAQTYDPYGNRYAYAGPSESLTSYGYTGEMVDEDGLVFLRARYYNPQQGRFLNLDPSRQEVNPYVYSYNNPINFADPNGNIACPAGLSWLECQGSDVEPSEPGQVPPPSQPGDETTYPTGVIFSPAIDVGLAPGIPTNTQDIRDDDHPYIPPSQFSVHLQSCGVVALAMILQANPHDFFQEVLDILGETEDTFDGMTGNEIAKYINESELYSQTHSATHYHVAIPKFLDSQNPSEPAQPNSTDSNHWASILRMNLSSGKYLLPLVTIDGSGASITRGSLLPEGTGVLHWIVVTGISHQDQWNNGPGWQWVRINNPFENQEEYYSWRRFRESVSNLSPNLVVVLRK